MAKTGQAGRSQTVASGGRVSRMLAGRPCQGCGSGLTTSGWMTSPPPYRAASVFSTCTQAGTSSGTPSR